MEGWGKHHGNITPVGRAAAKIGQGLTPREQKRVFGGSAVTRELNEDFDRENRFLFAESLSNYLFEDFIKHKFVRDLGKKIEYNTDHGFSHTRRLEKLAKDFNDKDSVFRRNKLNQPYFLFAPSLFLSMRFHDLLEIPGGMKKGHAEGAALLTLGYLLQARKKANRFSIEAMGKKQTDWRKIVWATAITCLYHSNPTLLPEIEKLKKDKNGRYNIGQLIDMKHILQAVKQLAGDRSIYDLFPPFRIIRPTINGIEKGLLKAPHFTEEELRGLYKAVYLFAAIDKIDSIDPPGLSSGRTLLSKPDRLFYQDIGRILRRKKDREIRVMFQNGFADVVLKAKRGETVLDIDQELFVRLVIANNSDSPDDFSRYLFELQRASEFAELNSSWVQAKFKKCLEGKGDFLARALPNFLAGNFTPFTELYIEEELAQIKKATKGMPNSQVKAIIEEYQVEGGNLELLAERLNQGDIKGRIAIALLETLRVIQNERDEINRILHDKYVELSRLKYLEPRHQEHMKALFEHVIKTRNLPIALDMRANDPKNTYFPTIRL